jgi:uncharacterized protein with GYD domain
VKGLLKEGGTGRRKAVDQLVAGLGGKVEAFYYALGDEDVFVIADLPDNTAAAAISLAVNATGAVQLKTVPLLAVEDIDEAAKKTAEYRPPGG